MSNVQCKGVPGVTIAKTGGNLSSQRHFFNLKRFIRCFWAYLLASGGCQHVGDDYHLHFAGRQTLSASLANWGAFQRADVQVRQRQSISFCLLNTDTPESGIFDLQARQKGKFLIKRKEKKAFSRFKGRRPAGYIIVTLFDLFRCWNKSPSQP